MQSNTHLRADGLLLLVTLLAAAGWIFSKEALAGLPPLQFIGIRFLLAGLVLAALGWRTLRAMGRREGGQAVAVGVLFAAAICLWIMGLNSGVHLGEGAFITALGIVLVPVISRWVFGDPPPRSAWLALPVAVAGFALLSLDNGFRIQAGQWFYLASALVFAFLFNFTSRVARRIPAQALTAVQLLVVGVLALGLSAALESWPAVVAIDVLGWLLASALIATTLRFLLQVYAQGLTSASHAAVIMMLEPVWTALLAGFWFDQAMSALQLSGCGLIFLALVINRWAGIRRWLGRRG